MMVSNWQRVCERLQETELDINTSQTHTVRLLSESPKVPASDRSQRLQTLDWKMSWTGLMPLGKWAGPGEAGSCKFNRGSLGISYPKRFCCLVCNQLF